MKNIETVTVEDLIALREVERERSSAIAAVENAVRRRDRVYSLVSETYALTGEDHVNLRNGTITRAKVEQVDG